MSPRRLKVPLRLIVVTIGSLSGCGSSAPAPPTDGMLTACSNEVYCTTDAAQAVGCVDGGTPNTEPFISDLGSCYPPV